VRCKAAVLPVEGQLVYESGFCLLNLESVFIKHVVVVVVVVGGGVFGGVVIIHHFSLTLDDQDVEIGKDGHFGGLIKNAAG